MVEYALPRDTVVVRGPDRKSWLDGLLTCKVTDVAPTVAGYGLLLTKQGKIVTDAFLADSGTELFVGVAPGQGAPVRELLDRYLVMEDAELTDAPAGVSWRLGAFGATSTLAQGGLVLGGLQTTLSVTREPGPSLPPATELLAEHGLGVFGIDFGERDNPHEASLERIAVSWSKGCYLGQEVVCMQDMRGKVKRRMVALDGSAALREVGPLPTDVLAADGSVAGQVSSIHPTSGGTRLLASISSGALESGAPLTVQGQRVTAKVS